MKTLASSTVRTLLAVLALGALTIAQRTPETPGEIARAVADGRARADEIVIKFRPGTTAAEESDARAWVNAQRSELLNTPEAVIRAADEALYRAKEAGRNRVST